MCCPPKSVRKPVASLRSGAAFRQVYRGGVHTAGFLFVVYCKEQGNPGVARLGLSVSKKVGNAVVRNRVKRHIREICRLRPLPDGYDYVVVARAAAGRLSRASAHTQTHTALAKALARLGIGALPQQQ